MKKERVVMTVVIVVAVILLLAVIRILNPPAPEVFDIEYSDDPVTWVDDVGDGFQEVDVDKVTKGGGWLEENGQQYVINGVQFVFEYDGLYNGEFFLRDFYLNEEDEEPIMSITPDLNPDDGIIDGFIVQSVSEDAVKAYVFVDEDWKRVIGDETNIVWGLAFENIKKFEFNSVREGVYMDSIDDDRDRFSDDFRESSGGVAVGNVELEDIEKGIIENLTLIRLT